MIWRTLIYAAFLFGCVSPTRAQMIYYGNLNVYHDGADGYSYAVVPYGVVLWSEISLSEDFQLVDDDHGWSHYTGDPVYLDVLKFGSPAPYTLYSLWGEAEGELPDYGWFLGWLNYSDVTPPPTVTVTSAGDTYDGGSGSFSIGVQGGYPTSYAWSYSAPAGAGNNPNVTFSGSDPNVSSNAHWFAYPDGECYAVLASSYQIEGQALIAEQWYGGTTQFTIHVPSKGGETHSPYVWGTVLITKGSDNVFRVTQNNLVRTQPVVFIDVLQSSQFRIKVEAHENVHVMQFTTGMFGMNWDPQAAYSGVSQMTDTNEANLLSRVGISLAEYNTGQVYVVRPQMPLAEFQAYALSDMISPMYVYQGRCNNFGQ